MKDSIDKKDYALAIEALEKIVEQPVDEIELIDDVPPLSDLEDSNKVFNGKLTILFVDMRKSTELTDELKSKKMVKIYRSFIRSIIQSIRYAGGFSRQFAGDGIMGVFQDSIDEEKIEYSSSKAIYAARYINTLIDYCLNPLLQKHMDNLNIACGIGICTGEILVTKAGMRGKEVDNTCENELGFIWVGSKTNEASRLCSLAKGGEIFIDSDTFTESKESVNNWNKCSRVKGTRLFNGYITSDYYLILEENEQLQPLKAIIENSKTETYVQKIFEETTSHSLKLIDEIKHKSEELSIKLEKIKEREKTLDEKEEINVNKSYELTKLQSELNNKLTDIELREKYNRVEEYNINRSIFANTFCKHSLIIQIGKDFWIKQIDKMISLGSKIGKSKEDVKKDLALYLVDIYSDLNMYEEAYDALCIQAHYGSWMVENIVEEIVKKSGNWIKLKKIIEKRINSGYKDDENDFLNALNKLKNMGY